MFAHAAPVLQAQWRSFRNARRGGGRVLAAILWLVWYLLWTAVGVLAAIQAASNTLPSLALSWALLALTLFWQATPFLTANTGATIAFRKLLIYPIPERELFALELLVRLGSAAESVIVIAGLLVGLLLNPSVPAVAALGAILLFTAFNLLLGVGLRSLMERLLRIRRLREVMVLVVMACAMTPQWLAIYGAPAGLERLLLERQNPLLPWAAASHLALGDTVLASTAALAAWTLAAAAFARAQFRRSLRYEASGVASSVAPGRRRTALIYRVPGALLRDPLAALVQNDLRSLARSPRFRVLFLTGFSAGMLIWWPIVGGAPGAAPGQVGYPVVVCAYALLLVSEVAFWNQFGFERGAVQILLAAPVSFATVLLAKNLAAIAFVVLEVTAVNLACAIVRVRLPFGTVFQTYAVSLTLALYFLAVGNLTSVRYPRPVNPEHSWGHSSTGRLQIYLLAALPLLVGPLALAYLAGWAFSSWTAFYAVLAFDAFAGAVAYTIATGSAIASMSERREAFLAALSESGGPIRTE